MDDDSTFNMFWYGGALPPLVWACMRSFVERGHCLRVFTHDDFAVPSGVILEDAHGILARPRALDSYEAIAKHADIFRYQLLHKHGGWWVDTDVYCLTDDPPHQAYAWAEQEPGIINNAILKFPKGDVLCGQLLAAAMRQQNKATRWGALGPDLMSQVVAARKDKDRGGSRSTFYPWHWVKSMLVWVPRARPELERRVKEAQFSHFWVYALRAMGINIYRDPPVDSFLSLIIEGCPNRVTSDACDVVATYKSIHEFLSQDPVRDKWKTILKMDPDEFFPVTS